jgi:hypothetical protein
MKPFKPNTIKFWETVWGPGRVFVPSITHPFEKETLMEHAAKGLPGDMLVVGCFYGSDVFMLAKVNELVENPGMVYGIDTWAEYFDAAPIWKKEGFASPLDYVEKHVKEYGMEKRVTLIRQDSRKVEWSTPLSLLVVDGDHSREVCLSDLNKFGPWVKPGGYIFVHDYNGEGWLSVNQAVDEWRRDKTDWDFYTAGSYAIFRKGEGR